MKLEIGAREATPDDPALPCIICGSALPRFRCRVFAPPFNGSALRASREIGLCESCSELAGELERRDEEDALPFCIVAALGSVQASLPLAWSYELRSFHALYKLEDLGGHLGRAHCRICSQSSHIVHSPMSKAGELELRTHAATHLEGT